MSKIVAKLEFEKMGIAENGVDIIMGYNGYISYNNMPKILLKLNWRKIIAENVVDIIMDYYGDIDKMLLGIEKYQKA